MIWANRRKANGEEQQTSGMSSIRDHLWFKASPDQLFSLITGIPTPFDNVQVEVEHKFVHEDVVIYTKPDSTYHAIDYGDFGLEAFESKLDALGIKHSPILET